MPRYRVTHQYSEETWEVESGSVDEARRVIGWPSSICFITRLSHGPYKEIIPPRVAVQTVPPKPGSIHVCPSCDVTMVELSDKDFWWRCPSCDQLYHELDNQFFEHDEI